MRISCFPAKNSLPGPPFASICGGKKPASRPSGAPKNALNGPQMNANSRKWAGRTLFWPVFMLFVVLSPVFSPPRTAFDFPTWDLRLRTSATPPAQLRAIFSSGSPFRGRFRVQTASALPHLRDRRYVAPQDRHKADLARILDRPGRSLFPQPAAPCAVDPPPPFRYSFATQEKSPRRIKPT